MTVRSSLMTVPYYHPILPLIIDNRSALRSDPTAICRDPPFAYPDDAAFHLEEAIASHQRAFGQKPRGVWPSEGAVSPEAAAAIRKSGLSWFASDEGVLARSVDMELERDEVGALLEPRCCTGRIGSRRRDGRSSATASSAIASASSTAT